MNEQRYIIAASQYAWTPAEVDAMPEHVASVLLDEDHT